MSEDFFQFFIYAEASGTVSDLPEEGGRELCKDPSVRPLLPCTVAKAYPSVEANETI